MLGLPIYDLASTKNYIKETADAIRQIILQLIVKAPGLLIIFLTVRILDSKFFEGEEHVKRALSTRPLLECTT